MTVDSGTEVAEISTQELDPGGRERILFNFIKSSTENRGETFSLGRGYSCNFYLTEDQLISLDKMIRQRIEESPLGVFRSEIALSANIQYVDQFDIKLDSLDDILAKLTRKVKIASLELKWSYFDIKASGE